MQEAQKAAFNIENYIVKSFSFKNPSNNSLNNIELHFNPSGEFYEEEGRFLMELKFKASYESEDNENIDLLDCCFETTFMFASSLSFDELPAYFFRNSLGIVFPYVRAFVSTLTFQAGVQPLILPLLNLTTLEEKFKSQVKVISKESSE